MFNWINMHIGPRKDTSKGKLIRDNFFFCFLCFFVSYYAYVNF